MIKSAKVIYGLYDSTIEDDTITPTSSSSSSYSVTINTLNDDTKDKIAYLEKNLFLLDGTFITPEAQKTYNTGWESGNLSDESGNISAYLQYSFLSLHSCYGIQLTFPVRSIAKDFTLKFYNGTTQVGNTITVTNNTKTNWTFRAEYKNWNKVLITFTKVNPQQRARLDVVKFGIQDTYLDDIIISLSSSRVIDPASEVVDSGDFILKFFNDGRYNVKSIKDLPVGLQKDLRIDIFYHNGSEYKKFGSYVSQETTVFDKGKVISIVGYDELYPLADTYYKKGVVAPNGRTLKQWAEDVATDGGISIIVDNDFANLTSKGYIGFVPHKEALRLIAEAGCGYIEVEADGGIHLKKHTPTTIADISDDEVVDGSLETGDSNNIFGVAVERFSYTLSKTEIGLAEVQDIVLTAEPQVLEIEFSQYPAVVTSLTYDTSSSMQIVKQEVYSDRAILTVKGTAGDTAWVTIIGKAYNTAKVVFSQGNTARNTKTITNTLITETSMAQAVADYQFNRLAQKFKHTAEVVTDTKIDLGDKTKINNDNVYITKVENVLSKSEAHQNVEGYDV